MGGGGTECGCRCSFSRAPHTESTWGGEEQSVAAGAASVGRHTQTVHGGGRVFARCKALRVVALPSSVGLIRWRLVVHRRRDRLPRCQTWYRKKQASNIRVTL